MIDFNNASFFKLKEITLDKVDDGIKKIILEGEEVLSAYQGMRDSVVFTDKRVIAVNVQGISGKKIDFTSLPYKNIVAFSVETSGTFDLDAELELWFSGIGKVKFDFKGDVNIKEIGKTIASYVL